ncbi:MAG: glycerol-3-phosphate 1-O-acyltransferase PlsY [Acidobacteria bacterium]|nr:glycerol-3-phosphate 1-O-acyltransferase PlsY [Acidobacteriota bacterium]
MQLMPLYLIAGCYLLGSIPFSYLVARYVSGEDIRTQGSGNVGATNVLRTHGKLPGALALTLDLAKGWFAIWLARYLLSRPSWPWVLDASGGPETSRAFWLGLAALLAVVAHVFPMWLGFRGGKGVATAAGVFLGLNPAAMVVAVVVFLLVALTTHYVSLGSVASAATMPPVLSYVFHEPKWILIFSAAISLLIIVKHQSNLRRILGGSEDRFPK